MDSISEFFAMGGYAVYVWPSYIITILVLLVSLISSIRFVKDSEKTLKALQEEKKQ